MKVRNHGDGENGVPLLQGESMDSERRRLGKEIELLLGHLEQFLLEEHRALVDQALAVTKEYKRSIEAGHEAYFVRRNIHGATARSRGDWVAPRIYSICRGYQVGIYWTLSRVWMPESQGGVEFGRSKNGDFLLPQLLSSSPKWARNALIEAEFQARKIRQKSRLNRELADTLLAMTCK